MKQVFTYILLATSLFISCKSAKQKGKARSMDTVVVNAFSNPKHIYRAAAPREWALMHTRVALSFDYKEKTAVGTEWVCLQPYFYPTDSLTLDAKGMKIVSVTIGHLDKPLKYTYDSSQLHIKLDKIYTQKEQVKLTIKYVAMPYAMATSGSAAITDDRGLYFINTDNKIEEKPVQIWTQGETESNSHWLPTIDKPNSRTTIQIELTVPKQYKTLSNGALILSSDNGDTRTDIWKIDQPIQVYAIMFAIGDFAIIKDQWKGKEVNYYVEHAYAKYARTMFQHTPEMIEFFSNVTGVPYPWNKYSQVVVRDYVSGAMENTSASLFGEFMNQDNREYADANHEDVVSHELFHQWFGDYVTAESWSNLTVNESFATYGEYLWRKHKYSIGYADELAWADLQRYLSYTEYVADPVLVRHHYRDKEDMFDRVSYQKGGAILHYLHSIIGDTAFYKSMQIYLSKNALQSAEATHWRLAVEEATGKDFNWFFDQWYYRAGHPILDINYNYDNTAKKLTVSVSQKQSDGVGLYSLPLKTLIINGTEKRIIDWNISKAKETYVYSYQDGVAPVIVPDVAHVLPGTIKENKTYKEWWVQMEKSDDFVSQLLAVQSVSTNDFKEEAVQKILKLSIGQQKYAALREEALKKIELIENEAQRSKWTDDIKHMVSNDGNNAVRATAVEIAGKWKIKESKLTVQEAINDSSYLVAGNALYALYLIEDTLGYTIAKQNLNGKPNTNLDTKAWAIIAENANDADTTLFQILAHKKAGMESRKHLSNDVATYAVNTKNKSVFDVALVLLAQKIRTTENKKIRLFDAAFLIAVKVTLQTKNKKTALNVYKMQQLKALVQKLNETEKDKDIKEQYAELLK